MVMIVEVIFYVVIYLIKDGEVREIWVEVENPHHWHNSNDKQKNITRHSINKDKNKRSPSDDAIYQLKIIRVTLNF